MEKITIKEIAKICGVSVSTVSRAMNDEIGISEKTKAKILKVMEEYHYVPNNSARNLKRQESRTIAVLIKGINNSFFSPIISIFEQEIINRKYSFIIQHVDEHQDEVNVAIELEKEKRLKGIIFLGGTFSHKQDKLNKLTVPYVLSTVELPENMRNEFASISVDDEKESYKLIDFLCKKGHKKIAILSVTEDDESIGIRRLRGYRQALKDNHIPFDQSLVYYLQSGNNRYSMESGYCATKELLEDKRDCTAIFAITDNIAFGCCRAILESGKRIPEDYSVVGFDGIELAKYCTPSLTTIRQPFEKIAKETVQLLFDMIHKKRQPTYKVFSGELLLGESTTTLI